MSHTVVVTRAASYCHRHIGT